VTQTQARSRRHIPATGAEAVYAWLTANERSGAWLARQVGRSRPHVQEVLRRERDISPSLAADIARVTGVAAELLLPVGGGAAPAERRERGGAA